MSILENIITKLLQKATIVYKAPLSSSILHIRIQSPSLQKAEFMPGYFLRVWVADGQEVALKEKVRSYSIWNIDQEMGMADLAVAIESDGPGAKWAKKCAVGDRVYFKLHKSKFVLDNSASHYLFVGDLSSLGQLYDFKRNLGKEKTIMSVIYARDASMLFPDLDGRMPFDFYAIEANKPKDIIEEVKKKILDFPVASGIAYIAGDSRICVAVNQYLKATLNWPVQHIKTKPFWNPLKTGLE